MRNRDLARAVVLLTVAVCCMASAARGATVSGAVVLVNSDSRAANNQNHADVVVWLEPMGNAPLLVPPTEPAIMTMDQRDKTFVPHLLAIQAGTAVDFPNSDPINHNVFSNFDGQIFDVHLYSPQTTKRVVFRRVGMVRVFCNIHDTMSAVIAVLPTPYFAVTNADGRYAIDAPPGEYRLRFWHEHAQPDDVVSLERLVRVGTDPLQIAEVTVPVRTEPVVAHKDKYGHAYHERAPEYVFYPGVRR